ncbi:hypothetical protein [Nonomuraea sp. NPDC001699]
MHHLLLAPAVATLAAALLAAAPSAAAQATASPACTNVRTGAPVACPEPGAFLQEMDRMCAHMPGGCPKPGAYDPEVTRPAVMEWEDPYNPHPGANPRN